MDFLGTTRMTPQQHAAAITLATRRLRDAVDRARREIPTGRAQVVVAGMADALEDFDREVVDLDELVSW